jgi:hypothetical protein
MKFQVIHESGLWVTDILQLSYFYPYQSRFEADRIDYNSVKIHGMSTNVIIKKEHVVYAMEVKAIEDLYWSILVIQKYGIHVYNDTSLIDYVYSIPYQTKINIINRMYVDGCYVYQIENTNPLVPHKEKDKDKYYIGVDVFHYMYNSTPIVLTPIRNILFGRILNTDGVLVRETKEIYSPVVGVLNINSRVYIKQKDFSTIPTTQNIARYELINNKGWINVTNGCIHNVYIEGYIPFDEKMEDLQMTIIDFDKTCFMKKENDYDKCIVCMNSKPECVFIHGDTGHSTCCLKCGNDVMKKKMKCPTCRQKIEKLIRLF